MTSVASGFVLGGPRAILRVEGGVLFAASIALFAGQGQAWWLYPALLLAPDIFMIGYARSPRLGALTYNLGHATPVPAAVVALGFILASPLAIAMGAIWLGHIGWDRMLGYGLKYATSFQHTHLGAIGRSRTEAG